MKPTIILVHGAFAESSSWDGTRATRWKSPEARTRSRSRTPPAVAHEVMEAAAVHAAA